MMQVWVGSAERTQREGVCACRAGLGPEVATVARAVNNVRLLRFSTVSCFSQKYHTWRSIPTPVHAPHLPPFAQQPFSAPAHFPTLTQPFPSSLPPSPDGLLCMHLTFRHQRPCISFSFPSISHPGPHLPHTCPCASPSSMRSSPPVPLAGRRLRRRAVG